MNKIDNVQQCYMHAADGEERRKRNYLFDECHKSSTNHFKLEVSLQCLDGFSVLFVTVALIACQRKLLKAKKCYCLWQLTATVTNNDCSRFL